MYFPMLRWKKGEAIAMQNAPSGWEKDVMPIWMFEERYDYLTEYTNIKKVWSGNSILDVTDDNLNSFNAQLLTVLSDPLGFIAVSLDQLPSMSSSLYQAFSSKPVIKIRFENLSTAMDLATHQFFVNQIKQSSLNNIFLILDFVEATDDHLANTQQIANYCDLYALKNVSSVILSSGVFPKSLDGLIGRHTIPRKDKAFYNAVVRWAFIPLSYSDYVTIHPWWRQKDTLRSGHLNLRYTHNDYWLVLRAHGKGGAVSHALAQLLVTSPEYRGQAFSWADKIWYDRSLPAPLTGPGNSTMHVSEFVHHHIAQVLAFG